MRQDILESMQQKMLLEKDLEEEKQEIKELCKRTDLVCIYCKKNSTKANRKTGEVMPCKICAGRQNQLKSKYGLNLHAYAKLLEDQQHKCAICGKELGEGRSWAVSAHVDHCHDVGHVRGVLCGKCNTGIGAFGDDEDVMEMAIKYIKFNRLKRQWWRQKFE